MRNYDTTNHKPYPRVTLIEIKYDREGLPSAEYVEQISVVDGDGKVQHLDASSTRYAIDFNAIAEPVQIVNPINGNPIPGQFTNKQQVLLSLLAFLRADQLLRDSKAQ